MGRARWLVWLVAGLICACSGSDETPDAGDGGLDATVGADTGPADTGSSTPDAGVPDSGADDENDSFDEAVDGHKNTDIGVPGAIAWPGDRDYYVFEGEAGEFVSVFTTSTPSRIGTQVDTVLRLYDATFTQVAENDDAVPRVDVNSEIIYRLPAAGRYYVEVLEWSDWAGETPEGSEELRYRLLVRTVNDLNPGVTIEAEAGNDAGSAIAADLPRGAGLVCGDFEATDDVDVFSVSYTGASSFLYVQPMPQGVEGYGSTSPVGAAWLTDLSGQDVIARRTLGPEALDFSPAAPGGDYLLWVSHPGASAGANDFYVLKAFVLPDNDPEVEPNDTRETADHRDLLQRQLQMDRAGFVLARLPDGDVDVFEIEPAANESVTVVCGGATAGSGVRGMTVEVSTADGTVLASGTEVDTEDVRLEVAPSAAGVLYVRLAKTGQDPELSGDYVRCGFFAAIE